MESFFKLKWDRKAPARPLNREVELRNKIEKSGIDNLTGLWRRELLEPRLNELINALKKENHRAGPTGMVGFAVIFADLDGFKPINDKYGHTVGDGALVDFGERISSAITRKDVDRVYRYGGDEFVFVLPIEGTEDDFNEKVESTFKRIKGEVNEDLFTKEGIKLEASMGYAVYKKGDIHKTPEDIIQEADSEMYKNKIARKAGKATQ